MSVTRRINFRLYPTRQQEEKLHYWRRLHASLYNAAVANRKTQYQRFGHSVNYLEQQNCLPAFKQVWPEYVELGSHALQATLKRVDSAFARFFKGLSGYPKFKASRRYSGWTYPCKAGWKALTDGSNGHLELSNLGSIQIRGKARTWGTPTTCTIIWRHNKWYLSITVKCQPVRETGIGAVGMDLGCETAATLWDGNIAIQVANPRYFGTTLNQVKKASKKLRRKRKPDRKKRVKASRRWLKQNARVSKLKRKAANQRQDWTHKVAAQIVRCNSLVATEELNIKGMTASAKKGKRKRQKAGLNRSILDVGMGAFLEMLEYKLQEADGFLVKVPTKKIKPSQTCPKCGHQRKKDLSERVHLCEQCSYTTGRDVASAQVCLNYVTTGLGTSLVNARGVQTSTPIATNGWAQVWAKKRETLSESLIQAE